MIVAYDSAPEGRGANAPAPEAPTPPMALAEELDRLADEWEAQAANSSFGGGPEIAHSDGFRASARRIRERLAPAWDALAAERDAYRKRAGELMDRLGAEVERDELREERDALAARLAEAEAERNRYRGAVERFILSWTDLLTSLPDSYDCHLTCDEANAAEELLQAAGRDGLAAMVIEAHATHDQEDDSHYQGAALGGARDAG